MKILGYSIVKLKEYINKEFGMDALPKIYSNVPDRTREMLNHPIIAGKMYDVEDYDNLLQAIAKVFGQEKLRKYGNDIARSQMKGLYGILLKFLSLEKVLNFGQSMWNKQFSQGRVTYTKHTEDFYTIRISDFPISDDYAVAECHYFQSIAEMIRKQNIKSTLRRIDKDTVEIDLMALF